MHDSSAHFSVLQLTDPHILENPEATLIGVNTAYYFNAVLKHALSSGCHYDLCLVTGDLAQSPCAASYEYVLNALKPYSITCLCLPGNHDDLEIMQAVLNTEQINCKTRIVLGNWQIIALNSQITGSEGGCLAAEELAFLEQSLTENPDLFGVIAVHHHCLPTGSRWMDTMMIENAQELFDLIKRYPNVKTIINGHIHQAMDLQTDTVRVLTTPSTCFQFKPQSDHFSLDDTSPGYRWLNLHRDGSLNTGIVRIPEKLIGIQANTHGY
jgi:3',5'-cyclic-AMP phosphodiesterase